MWPLILHWPAWAYFPGGGNVLRQAVDRYTTVQASDGIKLVPVPLAKKVKPKVGRGERAPK